MDPLKDRLAFIEDLGEFLDNSHHALDRLYQDFGWKEQQLPKSRKTCKSKVEKNEFSEEQLLPNRLPPSLVNSKTTVVIDCDLQKKILQSFENEKSTDSSVGARQPPKTSGELVANFSREERLAIHNHVLATTAVIDPPPEIMIPDEIESSKNQSTTGLSHIELKKLERDMKRRRQAYRTKVSTKNKTQAEVTREIIGNMMELLEPKKEQKQLCDQHDGNDNGNYENRKDNNGASRYNNRKNHTFGKSKDKYHHSYQMYKKSYNRRSRSKERESSREKSNYRRSRSRERESSREKPNYRRSRSREREYSREKSNYRRSRSKERESSREKPNYRRSRSREREFSREKSKYRRSRSKERESSRERGCKRDYGPHSRDRKKDSQSISKVKYNKEDFSLTKEKKNLDSTKQVECNSKYELDDTYIQKEFEKNSLMDTYVKIEEESDQSTKEKFCSDSENEKKKDEGLSKSSDSYFDKGRNNSMKYESKNPKTDLSEGELVSSDSDNNTHIKNNSKIYKKKKKHKKLKDKGRNKSRSYESRNTENDLSEGEIISSDSDNNTDIKNHSKKYKKKKKHKEHKRRHKERNI